MDPLHSLALAGFLVPCFLAASTGAFFKPDDWYKALAKPWWNPPNWLFPPAWAVLFLMIATSAWLVWREAGLVSAHLVWLGSLVVNAAWSWLFFGKRRIDLAMVDVVLLWLSIVATMVVFAPHSGSAALLLVPYLGWTGFAASLNLAILRRNPRGGPVGVEMEASIR